MIEALDGRDDEGPSHPSVICRISHCFTVRDPLLYCCCWRLSLQEFLLTADNIPSRGIQCTKISFSQKNRKESKGEKKPTTLAWFLRARRAGNETAPLGSYELHPQRYVSVIARRSLVAGFLKISSIPWHYYPPVSRHNGAAVWHGRSARARHHGALPRSHRVGCWCSCRSPSSSFFPFPNCFLTLCISAASPLRFSCRTDRRMERTAHARSTHPVCSVLTGVATV